MMQNLNELAKEINAIAKEHGWHDEERSFGEYCSLFHAEISESLEEYRAGKGLTEIYYTHKGKSHCNCTDGNGCKHRKPEGIPIELADEIIRILDFCGQYGIDIEAAINQKIAYNRTRPYKHGGKVI